MEFQVPQFITKEATVITGITFRQFITLAAAGLTIFLLFFLLRNLFIFVVVAVFVAALAIIFSFGQVQGQDLPTVFEHFISFLLKPRVYVWRRKGMPESPITAQPKVIISQPEEEEEKRKIGVTKKGELEKLWREIETR